MKLKKLLKDIAALTIKGSKEIEVTGVTANSKYIAPGNLFVAKKGITNHGARYIPEAIAAGAVAVLTDMYDPSLKQITQIIHPHVAKIEGQLAARFYEEASQQLTMVGITGTNGKTTASFLIKHLLDCFQGPCGLIGTIEYIIGAQRYQAVRTTPDVFSNHKMLRDMLRQECQSAVMEVTSHALDQGRVDCIDFDVGIFTNLTLDHLDYHKTMEEYCAAKNRLFLSLKKEGFAIVNADSPWSSQVVQGTKAQIITYGIDQPADLTAKEIVLYHDKTEFLLSYKGNTVPCTVPLVGRFNVYNCLCTVAVALTQQISLEQIVQNLSSFPSVPGRLQQVPNTFGIGLYVDFAHSDDALKNVLQCLQELKKGRLITVFGCGGDRDFTKRPKMAKVSAQYSDITIVTSDNPRSEDPTEIAKQIVEGFTCNDHYLIELDRQGAIEKAISLANADDIILIAGKGHEKHQIFAHKTIEFDDCKVAAEICRTLTPQVER